MAVVPDIALGFQSPQPSGFAANPIGAMNELGSLQLKMNENQLFQRSMSARMKFGQMMATADSPEAAIQEGMQDPEVAAFAPDIMQGMASLQQTLGAVRGQTQDQASSGMTTFFQMLPQIAAEGPSGIDKVIAQNAATTPEGPAKDLLMKGMETVKDGLSANYDPNDPGSLEKFQQQLTGLLTHFGVTGRDLPNPDGSTSPGIQVGPIAIPLQKGGQAAAPAATPGTEAGPQAVGAAAGGTFSTPSTTQSTEFKNQADQVNSMEQDLNATAQQLPTNINRIRNVAMAQAKFQAGAGANVRMDAAQVIQGLNDLGIPVGDSIRKALGTDDLANAQLFQQEVANLALSNLSQVQKGLGEASAAELNNAISQFSVTKDPHMLRAALDFADQGLRQQEDRVNLWMQYKGQVGNDPSKLIDFPKVYMQNFQKNGIQAPSNLPQTPVKASQQNFVNGSKFPEGTIGRNKAGQTFIIQNGMKVPYHGTAGGPPNGGE